VDTLKTGFVVVLLLAVLYGVYVVLNKDQTPPTAEIAWHQQEAEKDLQIDISSPTTDSSSTLTAPDRFANSKYADKMSELAPVDTAAELGNPAILKAVLSPVEPEVDASKGSWPTTPVSATSRSSDSTKAAVDVSPINSKSFVPAPSLLSGNNPPPLNSPVDETAAPPKPRSLSVLPDLREPPAEKSSSQLSAGSTKPASKLDTDDAPPQPNLTIPAETTPTSTVGANPVTPDPSSETPTIPTADPPNPGARAVSTAVAFEAAIREASANIAEEEWFQALFLLSKFYSNPELSSQQQQELMDLLDPLAAKVIYSQEHLLADGHVIQRGETLEQIATANQIPAELLANINGIENPDLMIPGTKVKIVQGPFKATVNLNTQELTLFAGELYAGRFPISIGKDPEPQPGEYRVMEKQPGKEYFGNGGQRIPAEDPTNPYGRVWIGIGKDLAIHSSPDRGDGTTAGCISLSPLDAQDVFSILSVGSTVTIR
jgi:lipoprotein-anchoring transpeptidase ErfK/SrfK